MNPMSDFFLLINTYEAKNWPQYVELTSDQAEWNKELGTVAMCPDTVSSGCNALIITQVSLHQVTRYLLFSPLSFSQANRNFTINPSTTCLV